jgi:hypothetical protein
MVDAAGSQIRQSVKLEVAIFVCPVALSEQGVQTGDLMVEFTGIRSTTFLLVAGLVRAAHLMNF